MLAIINNILKVIMAVLLLLCLTQMPYSYYKAVRVIAMLVFGYLAYVSFSKTNKEIEAFLYIAIAVLFQPILKISLGRTGWHIVDVVIAVWLLGSAFMAIFRYYYPQLNKHKAS